MTELRWNNRCCFIRASAVKAITALYKITKHLKANRMEHKNRENKVLYMKMGENNVD